MISSVRNPVILLDGISAICAASAGTVVNISILAALVDLS